ncbi:hypothetical protein FXB42_16035 [Acetobacterium wieringae]|uniref:Glycosyltransferase n=1 Tax=Acetobacterium wieringae TaxID=52694 RepID=A0A5D0WHN2_9FIRM|nr:hypothetical protein [Acetobacterium wieringae]TYC82195.1 hypothetical protein FXB42_16035 [Acetobacterium wieringae]
MDNRKQASVLVLLHKSQTEKAFSALSPITIQLNINFEIIISDDGSKIKYFRQIKESLEDSHSKDYIQTKRKRNIRIAKNNFNALQNASVEYIFATSPRDVFFVDMVQSDFYCFARMNDSLLAFGNDVSYKCESNKINYITGWKNCPVRLNISNGEHSAFMEESLLFPGNILVATFFRERENSVVYLKKTKGLLRYAEVNRSAFMKIAEVVRFRYYVGQMVWYKYVTVISTNETSQSKSLLIKDFDVVYLRIIEIHLKDPVIDAVYFNSFVRIKTFSILCRVLSLPILFIYLCRLILISKKDIRSAEVDKNKTKFLLCKINMVNYYASN